MDTVWPPMLTFPQPPVDVETTQRIDAIRRVLEQLAWEELRVPYHFPRFQSTDPNTVDFDGYNAQLRIAFEYDGREHYQRDHPYNQLVNPTNPRLALRIRRAIDRWKDYIAAVNRIILIRVSYRIPPSHYYESMRRKYYDARDLQDEWTDEDWDYQRESAWRSYEIAIDQYQRAVAREE